MRPVVGLCGLAIAISCGNGRDTVAATFSVRDSAGVRIVESHSAAWTDTTAWTIDAEPLVRIGSIGGEAWNQFYQIRGVDLTPDGGVVVLDGGSAEVRRYAASGTHQWSTGKQGGGPGEFQQPWYVGQQTDGSFLVWDRGAGRLTIIGAGGELRGTERHIPASGDPPPNPYGIFASGALLATFPRSITPPSPGALLADTIDMWWYDRATQRRRVLATAAGPIWIWTGRLQLPVPFTANPLRAVAGNHLAVAYGSRPEVVVHDSMAAVTARYVLPWPAQAVSDGDVERLLDFWVANGYHNEAVWAEWLEHMPVPEEKPAFDRLVVSRNGEIWVRRFLIDPGAGAATWDVLHRDGSWLGSIAIPAGLDISAIGDDRLAGIFRDEEGVEYVHIYRLRTPF